MQREREKVVSKRKCLDDEPPIPKNAKKNKPHAQNTENTRHAK
jgi:hypothetical protein